MERGEVWRRVAGVLARRLRDATSFERELHAAGGWEAPL
jgi:hypothetical protein